MPERNGGPRAVNPFQELSPRDRRAYDNIFLTMAQELQEIRRLLEVRGGSSHTDRELLLARAHEGRALPAYYQELRAGQAVDVERVWGAVAVSGFLLALEPVRFRYRSRRDLPFSQPVELPAGTAYRFGGRGLAFVELLTGRAQLAVGTAGDDLTLAAGGKLDPVYAVADLRTLAEPQVVELDTGGRTVLDVAADASAPTTMHLDASPDGVVWFEDYQTWETVTTVRDGLFTGLRFVRLRADAVGPGTVTLALGAS